MTTDTEAVPATTSTVVPVTCVVCGADMTFVVAYNNVDSRRWIFRCASCGRVEEAQSQTRHHLWMNDNTIYVGSYWGPDDDPPAVPLPQPGEPTMDLLHPEQRSILDGFAHLLRRNEDQ